MVPPAWAQVDDTHGGSDGDLASDHKHTGRPIDRADPEFGPAHTQNRDHYVR